MTLLLEKYQTIPNDDPSLTKEEKIAFKILSDVTDRRGWRQEWDMFDEDIQEDILKSWINIIKKIL